MPDPLPRYEQELRAFLAPLGVDLDAQAVVFQLYRTSTDVIAALEAKALRPLGLSHTGFALLVTIWVGGPQEVRSLARKHRLSKPSIESAIGTRSEEHTSELQSLAYLVCRLLLEKKKKRILASDTWN